MKKIFLYLLILSIAALFILTGCKEEIVEEEIEEESVATEESNELEIIDTTDKIPPIGELQCQWQNPLPDGYTLKSIWCASPTDVFAVGVNGTIKHYDGNAWSSMESGTTGNLSSIWGSSSSDVFTIGGSYDYNTQQRKPVILHYNGSSWQNMDFGISEYYLYDIWGSSSTDVFVSGGNGSDGVILHYDGSDWEIMTDQLPGNVSCIWGSSSSDVYAITNKSIATSEQYVSNYASFIYHYDGKSWSEMEKTKIGGDSRGDTLRDIWGTSPSDIYAVGERIYKECNESHMCVTTVIYHYNGKSWSSTTSVTGRLYGVWGASSSDIYAVMGMQGKENIILHYNGSNWNTIEHEFGNYLMGVHGVSSSDVFMVGRGGLIIHYDGKELEQISGFGTTINYINNIWGSSSTDVYAVGGRWDYPEQKYHSMMLHYDGSSWSEVESEIDRYNDIDSWGSYIYDIWGTSSEDIFYVGRGGRIHHYNGTFWARMNSGVQTAIYGIWGSSSSDVFAVGQNGIILHYDGNSDNLWTPMTSGTNATILDIWGSPSSVFDVEGSSSFDVFAVGSSYNSNTQQSNPVILHYDGTSWNEMNTGITVGNLSGVGGLSSSDVFVVGGNYNNVTKKYESILLHYDGNSWRRIDNEDLAISSLNGVLGGSSSDLNAVGRNGSILHYDGSSWTEIVSGTSIGISNIWGTSSTDIFAATGQDGAILHYSK